MAATASDAPPKGLVSRAARLATGGGIEAIAAIKVTANDMRRGWSRLCRVRGLQEAQDMELRLRMVAKTMTMSKLR